MNIKELSHLLNEYQSAACESKQKLHVKTQLITYLSSCYWWRSPYIVNLFSEKIKQVKPELQQEIENTFNLHINQTFQSQKIADILIQKCLTIQAKYQKKLIDDQFINTLAIQVQKTPPHSFQRKQAVQVLIKAMETKNTYVKQGLGDKLQLSPQDYQDAFSEAKGESIRYVLDNIDKYDETKGNFMALINHWIPKKFLDAGGKMLGLKKNQAHKQENNKIIIFPEDPNSMTQYFSESFAPEYHGYQKSEEIKKLILADPKQKLTKPVRKDRSDITFKDVLIAINWEGETFKSLSRKWEIPYTSIKSFYEREFKQVKADLADYLQ